MQLVNNNPIESETLSALVERLSDDPNNEQLQNEIRAFDLMARKAFFTGKWQIETGGWLLLFGAIAFAISVRYYYSLTSKIEEPEIEVFIQHSSRILSSRWLLGTGLLLITLGVVASFASVDHLKNYEASPILADNDNNEMIELVDLTEKEPNQTAKNDEIEKNNKHAVNEGETNEIKTPEQKTDLTHPAEMADNYPDLETINQNYNSFRGPMGKGVSQAKNIPTNWNIETDENILWKAKIPLKGYSSPVIWGKQLFITGASDRERWVYCYNTENGEIMWQQQANFIEGSPAVAPKTTDDTGLAAPSVVSDGNFVVAIFGTGDIISFNMNGKRAWKKNLGVPNNHYGHSSSLLAWKEKIIVQYDTNKGGRLLTLNIKTGEIIWDIKRTSFISWASPILIEVNGKMQIVTSTDPAVGGYDLQTGKELWKSNCMMGEVGPSPAFGNGLVFAGNEYATLAAINPTTGEIKWEKNEYLPEVASPVVSDGLLFIATSYGVFVCYDAHTGNKYWEAEFDEGFYSSPVIADGKVYAIDMKGIVHIIKVDRQLQKIADLPIGEKITTTPAFSNGRIYIRSDNYLYCIGK